MKERSMYEEIHQYITDESERITINGAEPVFVARRRKAFLIFHGWCASAQSMHYLRDGIAAAGYSVLTPTLPGHGTSSEDMARGGPREWIIAARRAAQLLGRHFDEIHLMGVSMGGALTLQLAALEPNLFTSATTLNAPVFLRQMKMAVEVLSGADDDPLTPWSEPTYLGPEQPELTYEKRMRKSGVDLFAMSALAKELLTSVRTPLLVIHSVKDPVVPKECASEIVANVSSEKIKTVWLDNSYHISHLDLDRDEVVRQMLSFAEQVSSTGMSKA
jgi:carboxylesterase